MALTIPDDEHSETEAQWITLGKDATDRDVIVDYMFQPLTNGGSLHYEEQ